MKLLLLLLPIVLMSCVEERADTDSTSRIVSFAPSITEILYELKLGDNVVGVTRFCKYPTDAVGKEKIGEHASFNFEAVARLKPNLAVILKEQRDISEFLDKYKIRYITVGNDSVDEILNSVKKIAKVCQVEARGDSVVQNLRSRMDSAPPSKRSASDRPKVLLCVGRENQGSGTVNKVFAAGGGSFYDQLIKTAGGVNILNGVKQAYPSVSTEAILRLDPDVIIDLSSSYSSTDDFCDDWSSLKNISAVKNKRVYCLTGDHLTIPGPRFGMIVDDFKGLF